MVSIILCNPKIWTKRHYIDNCQKRKSKIAKDTKVIKSIVRNIDHIHKIYSNHTKYPRFSPVQYICQLYR